MGTCKVIVVKNDCRDCPHSRICSSATCLLLGEQFIPRLDGSFPIPDECPLQDVENYCEECSHNNWGPT